jgi:hypothetical protein
METITQEQIEKAEGDVLKIKASIAADLKNETEQLDLELKKKKKDLETIQYEILKMMEASEIDSFKAFGFTFFPKTLESVKVPKDDDAKRELFEFLKEKGLYDDYVTVNSQSLNSLFKALNEEAAQNGILDFSIPGLEEPTISTKLSMRKS